MLCLIALLICSIYVEFRVGDTIPDYLNYHLPINVRLDDLLSRLTTEELTRQLAKGGAGSTNGPAPAISRLNITPYQWRTNPFQNEHTSFIAPVNRAASFDRRLVYQIALASGMELRAKFNVYSSQNIYTDNTGINVFAPFANLLRHPFWGRNHETYGEDPYLAGELAKAYVYGVGGRTNVNLDKGKIELEKPNPFQAQYLMIAATCKHFAAHTGPETYPVSRLSFIAQVPERDMWLTYLPAFRTCLEAGAMGIMCAYSGLNGKPDCVNPWLLQTVLRDKWQFKGFVISDCGAMQFLVSQHKCFPNFTQAALAGIRSGMNIENSVSSHNGVYTTLTELIQVGQITRMQLVDLARPLFLTRFLQGEFDPPEFNPFRNLHPDSLINSNKHLDLSMITAAKSIVLLKRLKRFVPLQPYQVVDNFAKKSVALIGPFATRVDQLVGDYNTKIDLKYAVPLSKAFEDLAAKMTASDICIDGGPCNHFDEEILTQILNQHDLDLVVITVGTGNKVETENIDRMSLDLPGKQQSFLNKALDLAAGRGVVRHQPIPVIVLVFSAGPVNIQSAVEDNNVKAIFWCGFLNLAAGKAVLRVLLGNEGQRRGPDGPIHLLHLDQSTSRAWTKDQDHGYWWIPAARLPFTWYASVDRLANITDYAMSNQTYRYLSTVCDKENGKCKIPILFPFGYGLTYNENVNKANVFFYSDFQFPLKDVYQNQAFVVQASVQNNGQLAADEVVQVCFDIVQ